MSTCKRCANEFDGNFCPNCGAAETLARINGKYILGEIGSVLNFNKGILYTIRELIIRPGESIRTFIQEDRNRLVKPVIFLILCSLIYSITQEVLHFEDGYVNAEMGESAITKIFAWVQSNYGYANIIMGVFIALWARILFRKSGFNIFEILILVFFVMGVGMLIYTFFGLAESASGLSILHFGGIIGFLYTGWAIGRFFNTGKFSGYVLGFLAYFIGFLNFTIVAVVIGALIDMINGL